MGQSAYTERRQRLLDAVSRLSAAQTLNELIFALRDSARLIGMADGICIVRREGDSVHYVAEDAIGPLWTGQRFPIHLCISGISMIENRPILIPDIYADSRVPIDAYAPTFVQSMAMFPIGVGEPVMAMGAYWRTTGPADPDSINLLSSLARAASLSFERVAKVEAVPTVSIPAASISIRLQS